MAKEYDKQSIGKDLAKGLLQWYRGGYPVHKAVEPPFIDESKMTKEELEYLW